jgi:hypothetical protein
MKSIIKRNDLILIGTLIIAAVIVLFLVNATKSSGSKVLVTIDGKEYETISLDKDGTYTVESGDGAWNKFVIKDGVVDMIDADCPDKLCVRQPDTIKYNNETIVCLPHKVVLQVINGKNNEVDAVAQ